MSIADTVLTTVVQQKKTCTSTARISPFLEETYFETHACVSLPPNPLHPLSVDRVLGAWYERFRDWRGGDHV